jgi:hypothetical protein
MIGAVVAFEVKAQTAIDGFAPALLVSATVFHPLIEVVLQGRYFVCRQHPFHYQKAVPLELLNLRLLDHVFTFL